MFMPVNGGRKTSDFLGGFRSSGGHSGVDFAAPKGTPIRAAMEGRVIAAGWGGAYGNRVMVRHSDGTIALYAHASGLAVKPGQVVHKGSVLGYVGSTGNSTGNHLHFEIRRNGKPVNPWPWLEAGADGSDGPDVTTSIEYRDPEELLSAMTAQPETTGGTDLTFGVETPTLDMAETMRGQAPAVAPARTEVTDIPVFQDDLEIPEAPQLPAQPAPLSAGTPTTGGTGELDRLIAAIRGKESGGNYRVVNRDSGALGAYQIMPANLPSWSKAALGYTVSRQQFLNSPQIQDQIARHRIQQYFQKHGARGAAIAWYAGEGALKYSNDALNRKQGKYPSIVQYALDVLRRAGL